FKVAKHRQVFVTQIARERAVISLAISRRKRGRYSREVIDEVVATSLIITAELWNVLGCIWPDDTGRTWICIGINGKGVLIKWRSLHVRSRMRQCGVHAELRKT